MKNTVRDYLEQLKKSRTKRHRMTAVLLVLSLFVAAGVFWQLRTTGISLSGETYCGYEEHKHSDACTEKKLICGKEESEGHTHSDSCYKEEKTLACDKDEHTHSKEAGCYKEEKKLVCKDDAADHEHSDSCYETEEVLVCDKEEHTHSDGCYKTEKVLTCDKKEEKGHEHSDDCYETVNVCGKEEHTHDLSCYSDKDADVETKSDWESTLPELTGDVSKDIVSIAKSQIGYKESTKNYEVDKDGETKKGYTRYGAWYGEPYEDWSAMFASFCIHYAKADGLPGESNISNFIKQLKKTSYYKASGDYTPQEGDLVLLDTDGDGTTDHIGIMEKISDSDLSVIVGDLEDQVIKKSYTSGSSSIAGYGILQKNEEQASEEAAEEETKNDANETAETAGEETEENAQETTTQAEDEKTADYAARVKALLAASDEEFVKLWQEYESADDAEAFEDYIASLEKEDEETYLALTARVDQLINGQVETLDETTPTDFKNYLDAEYTYSSGEKAEHRGTLTLSLLDANKNVVQKNSSGDYVVETGKDYQVQFAVNAISVDPGTYTYQLPTGIKYTATGGTITTSSGTNIGTWSVDASGLVAFVFNDAAQNAQDISFTYTATVAFEKANVSIPFDGSVNVDVKAPSGEDKERSYSLSKWGAVGSNGDLTWGITVSGNSSHSLIGTTITDKIVGDNQTMYKKDLTLYIYELDYTNVESSTAKYRHTVKISKDDPNLKWLNANGEEAQEGEEIYGWAYTVPETVTCTETHADGYGCNGTYTIKATDQLSFNEIRSKRTEGSTGPYINSVQDKYTTTPKKTVLAVEGQKPTGVKTSEYDAKNQTFKYALKVTIPNQNGGTIYGPYFDDYMTVLNGNTTVKSLDSTEIKNLKITTTIGGQTVELKQLSEAAESDQYAYKVGSWTSSGVTFISVSLWTRCECTEEHCGNWDGTKCVQKNSNGFCRCFSNTEDIVFNVTYEYDASALIKQYGGLGYNLRNQVSVVQRYYDTATKTDGSMSGSSSSKVEDLIPGVFDKEQIAEPGSGNGWNASFKITVNEGIADLSTMEEGVTITDKMSDTLVFLPGSLKITTTDENGGKGTLTQATDYTVSYDSNTHTATIKLLHPGKYKYTLEYAAAITAAESGTTSTYSNSATVTLLGHTYSDSIAEKGISGWSVSGDEYSVSIHKMRADATVEGSDQNAPLAGAQFGLFTSDGTRIALGTTDENGDLTFKTDSIAGLIFYTDTAYYIQEVKAPDGYNTDDTKEWFYFAGTGSAPTVKGVTLTKIEGRSTKTGTDAPFQFTNTTGYKLPSTGGTGTTKYIFTGLLLMAAPVVYRYGRRRREGRTE